MPASRRWTTQLARRSAPRDRSAAPHRQRGQRNVVVRTATTDGVRAADEALATELAPMWASNDVKRGMDAMAKLGPGSAIFEGD